MSEPIIRIVTTTPRGYSAPRHIDTYLDYDTEGFASVWTRESGSSLSRKIARVHDLLNPPDPPKPPEIRPYEVKPRWIPLTEREPEKGQKVVFWNGRTPSQVLSYPFGDWSKPPYYATHWTPLPDPPEGK
jgi:hypothetical protein